jgi:hypothetical protein
MAIDLLSLHPDEAERIAYAEGFSSAAKLLSRVADAQNGRYFAIEHLKAVLKAATEGDTAQLTRAVFSAYVFLEKIGHNIAPDTILEHDNDQEK